MNQHDPYLEIKRFTRLGHLDFKFLSLVVILNLYFIKIFLQVKLQYVMLSELNETNLTTYKLLGRATLYLDLPKFINVLSHIHSLEGIRTPTEKLIMALRREKKN